MTNTLRIAAAFIAVLFAIGTSSAEARRYHRQYQYQSYQATYQNYQDPRYSMMQPQGLSWGEEYQSNGRVVSHPSGCPRRAFCGCAASVKIFGKPIRSLFLASNWFKFPRTNPSPGMAAVRNHHVMVLINHIGGSNWVVYDGNSGGHLTRIHVRSIAGYITVNPNGNKVYAYAG